MHLRRVHIQNVRSFAELIWELPAEVRGPGWHVVLGDNGSGKSSFLRSIALALVGPKDAAGLRQPWSEWIRSGAERAEIELTIAEPAMTFGIELRRSTNTIERTKAPLETRNLWSAGARSGWFCASFGPFRRFTGGDKELEKLYTSQPNLARHLSVFGEAVALTEALSWLQSLKFKQLEGSEGGALLAPIIEFINQPGFLPNDVRIRDVTSKGVEFVDANGFTVPVEALSDGYRSVLSMTFEIVRQIAVQNGNGAMFSSDGTAILERGAVIIDEIDAHLHPSWQRVIGVWFRKHFPNLQFIVSTHSPLVCQAAEGGTVFRLPQPGVPDDRGEMVTGIALQRLLYGNVLDAYGTGVFGEGVTRSDSGQEKLEQLAALNARELLGALSDDEKRTQEELRSILPTESSLAGPP